MACVSRCIPRVVWYARVVGSPYRGSVVSEWRGFVAGEVAVVWSSCWPAAVLG
jgi:hypothetical protein